ncbi:MAG: NYN domain-containing protein [Chlamydiales bacterium]
MHYYIDGYNLLFRMTQFHQGLQAEREHLLEDLNRKISLLKLDVSIVFDAAFQAGGRSRTHLDALEILYTSEGETADEYILDVLSQASHPRQEIVVTSDKILAAQVRHLSAKVEPVEEFMRWLNRSYEKRLKQPEKTKKPQKQIQLPPPSSPSENAEAPPKADAESLMDYYQRMFEAEFQKIAASEEKRKIEKRAVKRTRQPKIAKDPFKTEPSKEDKEASDSERWLKIFEKNINHLEDKESK